MERRQVLGAMMPFSLAGCLRLEESVRQGSGDDAEANPTPEDTPESTPTETSEEDDDAETPEGDDENHEDVPYPVGLSEEGVTAELAETHRLAVVTETYASEIRLEYLTENETVMNKQVEVGSSAALLQRDTRFGTDAFYRDDEMVWRKEFDGNVRYGHDKNAQFRADRRALELPLLSAFLEASSFDPPEVLDEESEHRFSVTADSIIDDEPLVDELRRVEEIVSLSLDGRVSADGTIHELRGEFTYRTGGDRELAEFEYRVFDVGSVSVDEPDWVDTAINRAPDLLVRRTAEWDYLHVEHVGGDPIPSGSTVGVVEGDPDPDEHVRLSERFEQGDSFTVQREDGVVTLERDGRRDGGDDLRDAWFVLRLHTMGYYNSRVEDIPPVDD